jgi:hypothetical protein
VECALRALIDLAIGNLHVDKVKAFEFFAVYARYEYAAKDCRYVEQADHRIDLKINYKTLADAVSKNFLGRMDKNPELKASVEYYQIFPPKKQIWNPENRGPDWKNVEYTENFMVKLLLRLAQARNNLFHGGKGWSADVPMLERDNLLISHGLVILSEVIKSDADLDQSFSSYQ